MSQSITGISEDPVVRRPTEPWESDPSGVMNTVAPEQGIPFHQGPNAQSVLPDL